MTSRSKRIAAGALVGLVAFVLVWASVYGLGAFIAWEANPGKWTMDGRFFVGWVGLVASLLAGFLSFLGIAGEALEEIVKDDDNQHALVSIDIAEKALDAINKVGE